MSGPHQFELGREHYRAGDYDRALPLLLEAAREHTGFADLYNMLGVIHHAQGRFQDAEDAFALALEINPRYTEAALNLSVTYNDRGKYDEAQAVYARAVAASQGQPRSLDPFARGKLANMHAEVGAAYAGLGLYDEAVREYDRALTLCPDFVDLRVRLGNVYRDAGQPELAVAELERVCDHKPDYLPARVSLGIAYLTMGRRDDAAGQWREVLSRDPAHKGATRYLRMIKDGGPHLR